VVAVDDVSFSVPNGSFYTLLGPSGCGKTTTLRCVAGLERHDDGTIRVGERVVSARRPTTFVPPHRRDIGMVFQSYAIWPHMTVLENVTFPLRASKLGLSSAERRSRALDALGLVQLAGLEDRMATQLSGGQQQRLALARALVRRPRLLLLDEPLSNLDAKLRDQMRTEVRDLQRSLGITTLYVTHDQAEALSMSDSIAVMSGGRILQEGTARDIYDRPATRFVARFVGSTNLLDATVASGAPAGLVSVQTPIGPLEVVTPRPVERGTTLSVCIRPENIVLLADDAAVANAFDATVASVAFLGEFLDIRVAVGETRLQLRAHPMTRLEGGDRVRIGLPVEQISVLTDAPEEGPTDSAIATEPEDATPEQVVLPI
jgi:iron(III) transport system ATP-binding protein